MTKCIEHIKKAILKTFFKEYIKECESTIRAYRIMAKNNEQRAIDYQIEYNKLKTILEKEKNL